MNQDTTTPAKGVGPTRRELLGGFALGVGATLTATACADEDPRSASKSTRTTRRKRSTEHRQAIVIGTGFGGSATALRLAEQGVQVTMIERGKRWKSGERDTFATMFKPDRRVSWLSAENTAAGKLMPSEPWKPYTGLMERIPGDGLDIVCGAAVGGGSLPYHGMTVQPRGDLFEQVMPSELHYEEFQDAWYPLVRKMIKATTIPDDVLASDRYASSRKFIEYIRKAGLPDAGGVPMPIDWDVVRKEIAGELPPSISTGDVIYGVNGPGKHSLDTTYIPAAEQTGNVELLALHRVARIRQMGDGAWSVTTERLNTDGDVLETRDMSCDALFLCAGSPNTTKLLMAAQASGDIADLPDGLGTKFSSNGDLITTQFLATPMGTLQGGPANIGSLDWDNPAGPVTVLFAPIPTQRELNIMETVGIFLPDGHGEFRWDSNANEARLFFPPEAHGPAMAAARARVEQVGRAAGAERALDMTAQDPATFHPLGGAVIGLVCDAYGRVLDKPGLYVNDGALIPGSTACANPSLTIGALAERNIDQIIRRDLGNVF